MKSGIGPERLVSLHINILGARRMNNFGGSALQWMHTEAFTGLAIVVGYNLYAFYLSLYQHDGSLFFFFAAKSLSSVLKKSVPMSYLQLWFSVWDSPSSRTTGINDWSHIDLEFVVIMSFEQFVLSHLTNSSDPLLLDPLQFVQTSVCSKREPLIHTRGIYARILFVHFTPAFNRIIFCRRGSLRWVCLTPCAGG